MKWIEEMNEDVKHIIDAFALTILSILGLDRFATGVDIVPLTATWRTIAMDWILFASAVCTFIWLFFRAVDVIVERIEKFKAWRKK
jgi:hypothetical protein